MKWIGKHSVFSDLLIGGVLLTPPDPQYEYELTLPNDDGTSGQVLTTDGNGVLTWTTNGSGTGTVTSVDVSGGSTGLTTSGGAITSSGTITIGGTLAVGSGGTGLGTVAADNILTGNGTSPLTAESTLTYNGLSGALSHTSTPVTSFTNYMMNPTPTNAWASGTKNGIGMHMLLSMSRNTASGQTNSFKGYMMDINDSATHVGTVDYTGLDINIDFANTDGTQKTKGVSTVITDADTADMYGLWQQIEDGGTDLYFQSSDTTTADYFSIATGASGATTLATIDGGGMAADMIFQADGDFRVIIADAQDARDFEVKIDGATNEFFRLGGEYDNYSRLRMFEMGGTSATDFFNIEVQEHGATVISTTDGAATAAHFEVEADGDITLDAAGDIEINADGGTVDFKDGSGWLAKLDTNGINFRDNLGAGIIFEGATDDGNQTSLNVVDPTGSRAVNLPDASGTVALTSDIPDETVSTGTFLLKQTKVTMDATACNNLNASPTTLVAAQGANTIIMPVDVVILVDYNSTQSVNCDLIVGYNGTTAYTYAIRYVRRFMYGVGTDMTMHLVPYLGNAANSLTGGVNVPLTISTTAAITGGSLTSITAYTSYYVIDNS